MPNLFPIWGAAGGWGGWGGGYSGGRGWGSDPRPGQRIIAEAERNYNRRLFRYLPIDEATVLPLDFQQDKDKLPFNNCSEFVDFLVDMTVNASKQIIESVTVNNHTEVARTLGMGLMNIAFFGYQSYIHNGSDGFRNELTAGGQNAGVYSHVMGMAGARVGGFTSLGWQIGVGSATFDLLQKFWGTEQGPAEVAGNWAGRDVGIHMWNFLSGATPREAGRLRNSLMKELCK